MTDEMKDEVTDELKDEWKEKRKYLLILTIALLFFWLLFDVFIVRKAALDQIEDYSFAAKTELHIKARIKQAIERYQSSADAGNQTAALVHMLECNHYLLYNRMRGMARYYDFLQVVLLPSQRNRLKTKENYIGEAKRYLRRKRNLELNFLSYSLSAPHPLNPDNMETVEILVMRTLESGSGPKQEEIRYRFKKHSDQRYYLYFSQ